MNQRPETLEQVLSEKRLCDWLDLPVNKQGHSRQLANWIRGGLKYVEKSEKRYFFEHDVIEYLWGRYERSEKE